MNVAEAAAKYKVSKQAIYQHLNKLNGTGKNSKTGKITEEGLLLLETIYKGKEQELKQVGQVDLILAQETINKLTHEIDSYKSQVSTMQDEINSLNEQLSASKSANEALSSQLVSLREEHEKLHAHLASAFESIKSLSMLALPVVDNKADKKPSFFKRIFSR